MSHLTPDEVEALVMHGDPPPDGARRHLAACAACARVLEHEARLELEIYEAVAELTEAHPQGAVDGRAPMTADAAAGARVWRYALTAAAVLTLVVAGLLAVRRDHPTPPAVAAAAMKSLEGTLVVPPPVGARWPVDTPCLRDPRAYLPGFDVAPPDQPGLRVARPDLNP